MKEVRVALPEQGDPPVRTEKREMVSHTLPFGKHKGVPLPDVPLSYLQWLLREVKLSYGLRAAVADQPAFVVDE